MMETKGGGAKTGGTGKNFMGGGKEGINTRCRTTPQRVTSSKGQGQIF